MNEVPWLTLLTFTPLVGGLAVIALGPRRAAMAQRLALGVATLVLALTVLVGSRFDAASGTLQFVERHAWIQALGVNYHLGVDGLGLLMIVLTGLLVPMAMLASWRLGERASLYFGLMLWLEAGLLGTFTALNFFHWFLFWELSLVPAFFLIKLWGGRESSAAAVQFFVYTMVGSVAMLLGFLAVYLAVGTFDFVELAELGARDGLTAGFAQRLAGTGLPAGVLTTAVFLAVFLGLAVKVPLMPFHTWLPATYAEAPTGVTMLLTGAMSKMGVYGFLRLLLPIFPESLRAWQGPLLGLAVLTILFSAAAAFAQRDLKRLLAYSSINHLGYCLLGVFAVATTASGTGRLAQESAAALNGVLLQMFNHGLTAATLFCFVGWIEQRAGGLRGLDDFGGLRRVAPVLTGLMGIALFSSLGLPGLNGFVGEFLIFKGSFGLAPWATVGATGGLLLTAVFLLTLSQRVFHGPLNPRWQALPDLSATERWIVAPATALMFLVGLYPQSVLGFTNETVKRWVALLP
ncbi:MAG: NADH-quinone oxidoreductase subunit M [Verrucomicrobiales bacterium]|nr:NADH-quinone oxidoreductase subunit M [Verrucomicrobiales bacterium]